MAVPDALDVADSVPQLAPLHPVPDKLQVTPLFCPSFCTVAVNGSDCPTCTDAALGETATLIGSGAGSAPPTGRISIPLIIGLLVWWINCMASVPFVTVTVAVFTSAVLAPAAAKISSALNTTAPCISTSNTRAPTFCKSGQVSANRRLT